MDWLKYTFCIGQCNQQCKRAFNFFWSLYGYTRRSPLGVSLHKHKSALRGVLSSQCNVVTLGFLPPPPKHTYLFWQMNKDFFLVWITNSSKSLKRACLNDIMSIYNPALQWDLNSSYYMAWTFNLGDFTQTNLPSGLKGAAVQFCDQQ